MWQTHQKTPLHIRLPPKSSLSSKQAKTPVRLAPAQPDKIFKISDLQNRHANLQ